MLKTVEKAGIRAVRLKRNPAEITPKSFFADSELLREQFAKLINVADPKRIAILPSVSYGISTVAKNLGIVKGQHIIVAAEQFPSNYYPWHTLCEETGAEIKIVAPEDNLKERGKKWNEKILESINSQTRAVAIAHTHWADGTKFNLEAIRKRTSEVGALLIVDGSQSVGALPFDIEKVKPDALICAGYKWMLGPYSIGLAYYSETFDGGKPLEESWINRLNSEDFTKLVNYQTQYQPGALRYDVGEHGNFTLVPMMIKALIQLNKWHVENIQTYCSSISSKAIEALREKGFWIEDDEFRGAHIIGIRILQGSDIEKIKGAFIKNKIYVSFRGDAIRVSPNVYNDEKDLKKLAKVLTAQI
jgi:selenocysteine lyase/cysteine desulfurase